VVADVPTGQLRLRLNFREKPPRMELSDDGRTLLTVWYNQDKTTISCWDVPSRPSLVWVVGIPFALGCAAVLIHWWFAKKKRPPLPVPPAVPAQGGV
jgi:hypothetical protein